MHRVARDHPKRFDRVRLLAFHLIDELVLTQHLRLVALAAKRHGDGRVVEDHREAGRQHLARDAGAGATQVARQHAEQIERAVAFALVLIAKSQRAEDVGIRGCDVLVGKAPDNFRSDARDALLPLGRIACHMLAQARERRLARHAADLMHAVEFHTRHRRRLLTRGHGRRSFGVGIPHQVVSFRIAKELARIVAHEERRHRVGQKEVLVVALVLNDEVRHGKGKGWVGAWLHRDKLVGKARRAVEQKPDIDDLRAVRTRLHQVLCNALLIFDRIGAPHDDVIRRIEVCRIGRHVLVEIAHVEERRVERPVVEAVPLNGVGRTPKPHEPRAQHSSESLRGRHRRHHVPHGKRLGAVIVAQLQKLRGDFVERLVPADFLPLTLAAFARALQRMQQALRIVRLAARHNALLADIALVRLRAGVARLFGAHDLAVFDDRLDRTKFMIAPPRTTGVDERLPLRHD